MSFSACLRFPAALVLVLAQTVAYASLAQDSGTPAQQRPSNEAREACKPDYQKFCKGVRPGEGRIVACLKQHSAELSAACKPFVDKAGAGAN